MGSFRGSREGSLKGSLKGSLEGSLEFFFSRVPLRVPLRVRLRVPFRVALRVLLRVPFMVSLKSQVSAQNIAWGLVLESFISLFVVRRFLFPTSLDPADILGNIFDPWVHWKIARCAETLWILLAVRAAYFPTKENYAKNKNMYVFTPLANCQK